MTTILVNIHFIVAKLNNYIKNNKHKTGFHPNSRTNCHLQACSLIPTHYPSHTTPPTSYHYYQISIEDKGVS